MGNADTKNHWLCAAAVAMLIAAGGTLVATTGHADYEPAPPGTEDEDGWLNYVDYYVAEGDEVDDVRDRLIGEIDDAETRIDAAINELEDARVRRALEAAADRGVEVRIVGDEEFEDNDEFSRLSDHDGISTEFGDGELAYLPEPHTSPLLEHCRSADTHEDDYEHDDYIDCTQEPSDDPRGLEQNNEEGLMVRPEHYNSMSHTFFLIDETYVWNITAPLNEDQPVWLAFRAMSEEMANSFGREFRQMHGGVFSTTLSVYNGPLKSITHQNPLRLTNRGQLRVRFNPQERLIKNVIDETYRARSSVFVMTDNLTNEDLIDALTYKEEAGFEVRVLLGQSQAQAEDIQEQVDTLDPVYAPEEMGRLPTMVVIDSEQDSNDDHRPRMVQILSHELWQAQPYEMLTNTPDADLDGNADWVRFYPSDTFADGVLWEIEEAGMLEESMYNPELDPFVDQWETMWEEAQ